MNPDIGNLVDSLLVILGMAAPWIIGIFLYLRSKRQK